MGCECANDGKSEVFDIEEMGADQGGDNKGNKSDSCEVSLNSDSQVSDILKKPLVTGGMGALGGTVLGIGTTLAGEKVLNSEISTKNRGEKETDGTDIDVEQLKKDLKDANDKLESVQKSLTDSKNISSLKILFVALFGAWGLLHEKENISVPMVIVAIVLHVIFAAAGVFQIFNFIGESGSWEELVCGAAKVLGGPVFVVFDGIRSLFGSCMDVGFDNQS